MSETQRDRRYWEELEILSDKIAEHRRFYKECCGDSADHYNETNGWIGGEGKKLYTAPYKTIEDVWKLQQLGVELRNSSTAISIIEKLITYTIGNGHEYKAYVVNEDAATNAEKDEVKDLQSCIDAMMDEHCWPDFQERWARRYFEVGDVFLQWEPSGDIIDFVHLESCEISPSVLEPKVRENAPFGIFFVGGDMRRPDRYVYELPKEVASIGGTGMVDHQICKNILHTKSLGRRFPRGLPLLYRMYCPLTEIDELDYGATQVGLTYMEHTAVYKYDDDVTNQSIDKISKMVESQRWRAIYNGKPNNAGAVYHAKNHDVEMLSHAFQSNGFIDLIDAKARRVGAALCMPEFMVTGKSAPGSLGGSALVQQESPLLRMTTRLSKKFTKPHVQLFYLAWAAKNGYVDADANGKPKLSEQGKMAIADLKTRIRIRPEIPIPETQERTQRELSIMQQMREGHLDEITGITLLGHNYETVMKNKEKHAEREREIREGRRINMMYSPEELAKRITVYMQYREDGTPRSEAAELAGLDEAILPPEAPLEIDRRPEGLKQAGEKKSEEAQEESEEEDGDQEDSE